MIEIMSSRQFSTYRRQQDESSGMGEGEIQGRCQEVSFHMEDKMLGKEASVERSKVM